MIKTTAEARWNPVQRRQFFSFKTTG